MIDRKVEAALRYRTVAVVGLSRDANRDSYRVAEYLKTKGYRIIPVNPFADTILGEKSYRSLLDVPEEVQGTIEVVEIFRPPQDVPSIVEQAVELKRRYGKPYVIWMQLGIVNYEAAERAEKAGLEVVMDKCMMVEHKRLMENPRDEELERIQQRKMSEIMREAGARLNSEQTYPNAPVAVTDTSFEGFIKRYPVAVVDCWAPWCSPCLMLAPVIDSLAKDYAGRAVFGKLNVDENPETTSRFGIMSIPTLLVIRQGVEVDRIIGAVPRQRIESTLQRWL